VRAVGYHESVAGDLDRHALDAIVGQRPVRVQHRSGALWVLSSEALTLTGADRSDEPGIERDQTGRPTGRLWRMDGWLRERVPKVQTDLRAVSAVAAASGITGFTDATPHRDTADVDALREARACGDLVQRVLLMGPIALDVDGPVKVLLDDDRLPDAGTFIDVVTRAHERGRVVAVHCVTAVQLVLTLHALSEAGAMAGDRIEHASVVPPELIAEIARLGLTVVTQPGFVVARGDRYLADVDAEDVGSLYRCGTLLDAGVAVAAGTDAPFGPADPWACIRAAIDRRTAAGAVLGGDERVAAGVALGLFLGRPDAPATPRMVTVGATADLCLLDSPLDIALEEPSASRVAATIVDGHVAHRASV
jgi:predicted amidohydrolase YtcJ